VACEQLLEGEGEKLTRKCIDLALKGNVVALKLALDRVVPIRGARLVLDMPHIEKPADVVPALNAVVRAASSGRLSCEEAAALASVINSQQRALELIELEQRVSALEAAETRRGGP
jgi:hypothetical protein